MGASAGQPKGHKLMEPVREGEIDFRETLGDKGTRQPDLTYAWPFTDYTKVN